MALIPTTRIRQIARDIVKAVGPVPPVAAVMPSPSPAASVPPPPALPASAARPVTPADVWWVYKLFFGRPPEDLAIAERQASQHPSVESLCVTLMDSEEFRGRWRRVGASVGAALNQSEDAASALDVELIRSFKAYTGPGADGFLTDFLGTKTRVGFVKGLQVRDGEVEGYPIPGNFHASVNEWAGTLRSVVEAKGEFVGMELGRAGGRS